MNCNLCGQLLDKNRHLCSWKTLKNKKCRFCKKEVEKESWVFAYWGHPHPLRFACHKECKQKCYQEESCECQKLDADCNDCKYFVRGELISKEVFSGKCSKFNKEVKAYPNFCSGHKCFEHRS